MIVWLASYPRSGNTLLRIMLNKVFKQVTYSKYDDRLDIGNNEEIRTEVGHQSLNGSWQDRYTEMCESDERYFVKTHEPPEDGQPAIYVVRNGINAVLSYRSYLVDVVGRDAQIGEVIAGSVGYFPSWGRHLDTWNPFEREDTLLVRYEDLSQSPDKEIQRIGEFCDIEPQEVWVNEFKKLQGIDPKFFRKGGVDTATDKGMTSDYLDMFNVLHGDWMKRLSYSDGGGIECISSIRSHISPIRAIEAQQRNQVQKEIDRLRNKLEVAGENNRQLQRKQAEGAQKLVQASQNNSELRDKLKLVEETDRQTKERLAEETRKLKLVEETDRQTKERLAEETHNLNLARQEVDRQKNLLQVSEEHRKVIGAKLEAYESLEAKSKYVFLMLRKLTR